MDEDAPIPEPLPVDVQVGDIVLYFHPDDNQWYPAIVMVVGVKDYDGTFTIKGDLNLCVFRPRLTEWRWAGPGETPGCWKARS